MPVFINALFLVVLLSLMVFLAISYLFPNQHF